MPESNKKRLEWVWVGGVPLPSYEAAQIQSWAIKAHAMHPDYTVRLWVDGVDSVGKAAGGLRGAGVDIQSLNRNYNLPPDHKLYMTNAETGSDEVRQSILETGGIYLDPDVNSNTLHV